MSGARKLAIKVLEEECQRCEELYDGYRLDLARRLMAILRKENEASSGIVIETKSEIEDLGDMLNTKLSQ